MWPTAALTIPGTPSVTNGVSRWQRMRPSVIGGLKYVRKVVYNTWLPVCLLPLFAWPTSDRFTEADFKTAFLRSHAFTDVHEGLFFSLSEPCTVHGCSPTFAGVGERWRQWNESVGTSRCLPVAVRERQSKRSLSGLNALSYPSLAVRSCPGWCWGHAPIVALGACTCPSSSLPVEEVDRGQSSKHGNPLEQENDERLS